MGVGDTAIGLLLVTVVALGPGHDWWTEHRACSAVKSLVADNGGIQTIGDGEPDVFVLGDSYAAGDMLEDQGDRWVDQYAADEGVTVRLNAIGYTGFVNDGPCGDLSFDTRIDSLLADRQPGVLIVAGGMNDWQADPTVLREAVRAVLDEAASVPRVVLVGPANAPARDAHTADEVVRGVAAERDREYVSMIDADLEFGDDGVHMTAAGHAEYAALVEAAVDLP